MMAGFACGHQGRAGRAVYVCDWYDAQVNHYRNHEGKIDPQNGRVYRLRAKGAVHLKLFDLAKRTTPELIELLGHGDKWHRQTALRLLGDRKDVSALPALKSGWPGRSAKAGTRGTMGGEFRAADLRRDFAGVTIGHADPHACGFGRCDYWVTNAC